MIRSIRHKGLRMLRRRGDASRVLSAHREKLRGILLALEGAAGPGDLVGAPGLHPLRGDRSGFWALRVTANWRVVFRFEGGDVWDVDLVDYH